MKGGFTITLEHDKKDVSGKRQREAAYDAHWLHATGQPSHVDVERLSHIL